MKEIGEQLKNAREEKGVTLEEASEDLNVKLSQIQNIEEGNMKIFKDVYYLKCFLRDYSKYLGLNEEDIMDEFNEFFFEETSKIPIEEIEKASKEKEKEKLQEKKMASPYTMEVAPKSKFGAIIVAIIILLLLTLIGYIVVTRYVVPKQEEDKIITYLEN